MGPFGRGWSNDYLSAEVTSPSPYPVIAYPAAWTPGTKGPVSAKVVRITVDSAADFAKYHGKLRGKFVMVNAPPSLKPHFTADGSRRTDADLERMAQAPVPQPGAGRFGGPGGPNSDVFRRMQELNALRARFFADEGVAVLLVAGVATWARSSREHPAPVIHSRRP